MNRIIATLGSILLALVAGTAARAQVITPYTSLSAFTAALGSAPMTVEDFTSTSHFPISTGILNSATNLPGIGITPGLIQPGVTYSVPVGSGSFFNIDGGAGFEGGFLDTITGATPLTITFDTSVGAFGFDTNTWMGSDFGITINFTSGPAYVNTFAIGSADPVFFGFVSSESNIVSALFYNTTAGNFGLDNFRFTAVPEPGAFWLLGAGAAALSAWYRRRRAC
jgi:hypothetical protein